jgi:hypothetical protein
MTTRKALPKPVPVADDSEGSVEDPEILDVEIVDMGSAPTGYPGGFDVEDSDPVPEPIEIKSKPPKSTPPSLEEWQDFIGRVVLGSLTTFYLDAALRDIREDMTEAEFESVRLSKDDLRDLAAPIASLASKSAKAKKHGRMIVSSADSIDAVLTLMMWMKRIRRLNKKYRKPGVIKGRVVRSTTDGTVGQNGQQGTGEEPASATGGALSNPGTG